jgi:hypothetical protein
MKENDTITTNKKADVSDLRGGRRTLALFTFSFPFHFSHKMANHLDIINKGLIYNFIG